MEPQGNGGEKGTGSDTTSLHRRGSALERGNAGAVDTARCLSNARSSLGKPAGWLGGGGGTVGVGCATETIDIGAVDADGVIIDAVEVVDRIGREGRSPRRKRSGGQNGQSVGVIAGEERLHG